MKLADNKNFKSTKGYTDKYCSPVSKSLVSFRQEFETLADMKSRLLDPLNEDIGEDAIALKRNGGDIVLYCRYKECTFKYVYQSDS